MGTASMIQLLYLYEVYYTGIYFYWNLFGIVLFTFLEWIEDELECLGLKWKTGKAGNKETLYIPVP